MTQKIWQGTSDIWEDPNGWGPPGVPMVSDDAILGGTLAYTVTVAGFQTEPNSVTIDDPNAVLQIDTSAALAVASTIEIVSGSIDLQPNEPNSTFNLSIQAQTLYTDDRLIVDNTTTLDNADFLFTGQFITWQVIETGSGTLTLGSNFITNFGGGSGSFASPSGTIINDGVINGLGEGIYSVGGTDPYGGPYTIYGNFAISITVDASTFLNNGTINIGAYSVNVANNVTQIGSSSITSSNFYNSGLIEVSAGNDLVITTQDFVNTGTVAIGDGASVEFTGNQDPGAVAFYSGSGTLALDSLTVQGETVYGFAVGDTIDLAALPISDINFVTIEPGNTLAVVEIGGTTLDIQLDPAQNFAGLYAHQTADLNDGTALILNAVPCFCAGTRIATPNGDAAVEALREGDRLLTLQGASRRIVWIGTGAALATRGQRNAATPVIVKKGALADNVPHHDLHITKGHALFVDDVLIPVEFLINHRSIIWDDRAQEVIVYHIELETHDVLVANGAPAESYRDDGNRWLFRNANSGWGLPPQEPCAPVLTGGPVVDAVWRRLLDRAGLHRRSPLTKDADLHLLVNGQRINALERGSDTYVFRLPRQPRNVRIRSRAGVPQELGLARDNRPLGVAVRQIELVQARQRRAVEAESVTLSDGFHAFEPENSIRWTNGDAGVPAQLFSGMTGSGMLILHLGGATHYLDDGRAQEIA